MLIFGVCFSLKYVLIVAKKEDVNMLIFRKKYKDISEIQQNKCLFCRKINAKDANEFMSLEKENDMYRCICLLLVHRKMIRFSRII